MSNDHGIYWLLYDGDCRICRTFARWMRHLNLRGRIRIQTIQQSRDLLQGLPTDEILDAMHVVSPQGAVTTGGDSLPTLIEGLFSGPPLSILLRASSATRGILNRFYAVMAGFRGHLVCRYEASAAPPPQGQGGNEGF